MKRSIITFSSLVILTVTIVFYYSNQSSDNDVVIEEAIVDEDINQVEPFGDVELHSKEEVWSEVKPEDEIEDLF